MGIFHKKLFEILLREMADMSLFALNSALEPLPCMGLIPPLEPVPCVMMHGNYSNMIPVPGKNGMITPLINIRFLASPLEIHLRSLLG